MGIFESKETKAEKALEKQQKLLQKYGLQNLTDSQDIQSVRNIVTELAGSKFMEVGNFLAPDQNTANQVQIMYQRTIVEQNFIMIRQLDRIAKSLEK